jgi:ribosome-associated protein
MEDLIKQIKREVELKFVRSQGPGGQNVNKTNSAVQLRWNLLASSALSENQKAILQNKLRNFLNSEGDLILKTTESRDQKQNIEISLDKLEDLIRKALAQKKKRIKTKPTRGSKERRLQGKKIHSEKKQGRRGAGSDY